MAQRHMSLRGFYHAFRLALGKTDMWKLWEDFGLIRIEVPGEDEDFCPVTFTAWARGWRNQGANNAIPAGAYLGMDRDDTMTLMAAADAGTPHDPAIRAILKSAVKGRTT